MAGTDITPDERSQAFTLEGFISAIVILTAVLFALQAVVITPTTGGAVDRSAQAQEQQEVRDVLIIAGENGNLSELLRHWDPDEDEWRNGEAPGDPAYNSTQLANISEFGVVLDEQFVNASGKSYNLDFIVNNSSDTRVEPIVRMGGGTGDSVVSTSYTVTIHEDQYLTGTTTEVSAEDEYPFQPSDWTGKSYVVVEVRVTVW